MAEARLDVGARESARWCDLQIEFVDDATGELIGWYGGRWDRLAKDFAPGHAETAVVVRLHPGQVEPAKWWDRWFSGYVAGDIPTDEKIFDALYAGGRRGGKSALMFAEAVAFAVAQPGAIVWCVVPSEGYESEPAAYLESIMPREWYESTKEPPIYYLPNGSQIWIRSAHVPRKLKQGRADYIAINEGQAIPIQSYHTLSAAIVDVGGLITTAANPPDVGDPGDWVADLAANAERKDTKHARFFFFDPELNPHIDQAALRALGEKMDPHTYDVQVRGLFLLKPDTVLHSWDRRENEQPMPEITGLDCTRQFTKYFEGYEYDDVVSVDVQNYPWIAAVRFRAFRNPLAPNDMEQAYLWGVGEAFIEKGDEVATAKQLIEDGCNPLRTLVVMDASGDWQQAERNQDKQIMKYKGRGSMDMFRGEGFAHVVPPDHNMKANPDVADRCRAANARIGSKAGSRYLFVDPRRCPKTVRSIREWKRRPSGLPSRLSKAAHAGDCLSYCVWRFFPRRGDKIKVDVTAIKRFGSRETKGSNR